MKKIVYIVFAGILFYDFGAYSEVNVEKAKVFIEKIESIYNYREQLLRQSEGVCHIKISCSEPTQKIMDDVLEQDNSQNGNIVFRGKNSGTIHWYQDEDKYRFDLEMPPPENSLPNMFGRTNRRMAYNSERAIYFDVIDYDAYINKPPSKTVNPIGIVNHFEVTTHYYFNTENVVELLKGMLDKPRKRIVKHEYSIKKGEIDNTPCTVVDVYFLLKQSEKHISEGHTVLYFSENKNLSLINGKFTILNKYKNEIVCRYCSSYIADYTESEKYPGVWLLKELDIKKENSSRQNEYLHVTFENTEIGKEIPDKIFSFKGLGVPYGVTVYDKRIAGDTPFFKYTEGMEISLDNIDYGQENEPLKKNSDEGSAITEVKVEPDRPGSWKMVLYISLAVVCLIAMGLILKSMFSSKA